jgi:hypothetical protein
MEFWLYNIFCHVKSAEYELPSTLLDGKETEEMSEPPHSFRWRVLNLVFLPLD